MKPKTPRDFVIQLGSLITLYISITALLVLLFGIINLKFPDELEYYSTAEAARESVRGAIAFLVIFFPAYLVLTRVSNQHRRTEEGGEYTTLARWLVYLSLMVGGGVLLGDLVTVLMYYLNGEVTTRFILKALTLLAVVGAALYYYVLDVRGVIKQNEKLSVQFGGGALLVVLISLLYGFMNIETPAVVREIKLDEQQVTDLQDMQWRIEEYYRVEGVLPETVSAVYTIERDIPTAPTGRADYRYNLIDENTYELCATFAEPTYEGSGVRSVAYPLDKDLSGNYNWDHEAGEKCFKRVVIPPVPTEV